MKAPTDIDGVKSLVNNRIQENIHLDYKDSRALNKKKKEEIAKDVSAFANSDGGILVYGVTETDHFPEEIDNGVSLEEISKEWIDQIISSNISPKISNVHIYPIEREKGFFIYVIEVPKSVNAPHQASDKKYYKRYNFRSAPMEHYEVLDTLNRKNILPPRLVVDVITKSQYFYISIRNIGNFPIVDVKFIFPEEYKWPNKDATPGIFTNGLKFLGPGREITFMYGASWDIIKNEKHATFEVDVEYLLTNTKDVIHETFHINFNDYVGMDASKSQILQELDKIRRAIENHTRKTR